MTAPAFLTTRNATLPDMVAMLRHQRARRLDVVATAAADEGISAKLGINLAYLRRLREDRPDLWDANVNGWLHGNDLAGYPPDGRTFLVRLFQADGDGLGVARAILSDSYKVIDNLDALMAPLDGIRQAGVDVEFD